jgi:hypothetical protein
VCALKITVFCFTLEVLVVEAICFGDMKCGDFIEYKTSFGLIDPENEGTVIRRIVIQLHGVTYQKNELFSSMAAR